MPATSKAQFRFMQGVRSGSIKRPGLSPAEAEDFVSGVKPGGLPERKSGAAAEKEPTTKRRKKSTKPKKPSSPFDYMNRKAPL